MSDHAKDASRLHEAYLALGANLGDRLGNLNKACERLLASGVRIEARSPVYETDAVAKEPQPPYLNAALRVATVLAPEALLRLVLSIERSLGRNRDTAARWASRAIDIDVLLYEDQTSDSLFLELPHPRLLERPFVRVPLAEVARSGLRHPVSGEPLDRSLPHPGVRLFDGRL
ncbi:MAG: 2-amino-4-hydroxy-6-hydroxymethyldihydropteridine diphosphokinase [Myxococcales bacterium]|nr:2-amino-4-hydroxy-6-hydroxymethyldihydropteridine diphosphokinase [Myxococcales bacterium]